MYALEGKVAVVTGAASGIGRAIAGRLAGEGAAVVVADASGGEKADAVVTSITGAGGRAVAKQADIAKADDVARLFDAAISAFGGVDILVNDAGVTVYGALKDATEEDFDHVFGVNARGTFLMVREGARRLRDGGRMINISSSTVRFPMESVGIYAASKAAVRELTEIAAVELGARGITVNSVLPGPTVPGMFSGAPRQVQDAAAAKSPFGRLGEPADIARVVAFLASAEAAWISGQQILVNGAATI